MAYVIFDLETTGTNKEDRIIQICAKCYTKGGILLPNLGVLYYVRAPISISKKAMAINKITPEILAVQGKDPKFAMEEFLNMINQLLTRFTYVTLIAHNGQAFDFQFLVREFLLTNVLISAEVQQKLFLFDSLPAARLQVTSTSYALENIYFGLFKEKIVNAHNAESQNQDVSIDEVPIESPQDVDLANDNEWKVNESMENVNFVGKFQSTLVNDQVIGLQISLEYVQKWKNVCDIFMHFFSFILVLAVAQTNLYAHQKL
jgi:DNA polymerase III alpha subunit (gram-positive type)